MPDLIFLVMPDLIGHQIPGQAGDDVLQFKFRNLVVTGLLVPYAVVGKAD